jgi:hypothetical protein
MSIQVEMPKLWIAMDIDLKWHLFTRKPYMSTTNWYVVDLSTNFVSVTRYTGKWQDSLHQLVNGKWEKVT